MVIRTGACDGDLARGRTAVGDCGVHLVRVKERVKERVQRSKVRGAFFVYNTRSPRRATYDYEALETPDILTNAASPQSSTVCLQAWPVHPG